MCSCLPSCPFSSRLPVRRLDVGDHVLFDDGAVREVESNLAARARGYFVTTYRDGTRGGGNGTAVALVLGGDPARASAAAGAAAAAGYLRETEAAHLKSLAALDAAARDAFEDWFSGYLPADVRKQHPWEETGFRRIFAAAFRRALGPAGRP